MNNPFSQNPQQYAEGNRGSNWGSDEHRQNWRDETYNRGQGRSSWGGQQDLQQNSGQQYGQQGRYGLQENYGQQGGHRQSRYSPNFSGQSEFGQEWQRGGNNDDYGYYGNQNDQQRGQWDQEYSPYSGQGEPEYNPSITPRRQQTIRADQRGQQSRDWQQGQSRSQAYFGNQFGPQQSSWSDGQSTFGGGQNYGQRNQGYDQGNQFFGRGNQNYAQGHQTYGGQQFGGSQFGNNDYGSSYGRNQSGQSSGAFGLEQGMHRGKGPKGYTRTDERIREEICEMLSDDFSIDASEITVEVKDGVVTLEGSVQDRSQKHRVEDIADNCSGVKDVHNSLRVTRQASSGMQQSTGDKSQEKTQEKNANKSH